MSACSDLEELVQVSHMVGETEIQEVVRANILFISSPWGGGGGAIELTLSTDF